jgi:hypothetical protein
MLNCQSGEMMKRFLLLMLLTCGIALAQTDQLPSGSKETELFVQGGHSVAGGRGDSGAFAAGLRFGYSFLTVPKGTLEYTVDLIPVYYITQRQNAYGASFTPFNLKYNFTHFHRVVPYLELGGGVLFTNHDVPDGTNSVNFTPQAGIGVHFPIKPGSNKHLGIALKYIHISNAGLSVPNPGVNTVQIKLSVGHFCSPKSDTYNDQTSKCSWIHY